MRRGESPNRRGDSVNTNEVLAGFQELVAAMQRDRDSAVQRSPQARRDLDTALATAQAAFEHLKNGRPEAAMNLWKRNTALRLVARQYDLDFERVSAAFE